MGRERVWERVFFIGGVRKRFFCTRGGGRREEGGRGWVCVGKRVFWQEGGGGGAGGRGFLSEGEGEDVCGKKV